ESRPGRPQVDRRCESRRWYRNRARHPSRSIASRTRPAAAASGDYEQHNIEAELDGHGRGPLNKPAERNSMRFLRPAITGQRIRRAPADRFVQPGRARLSLQWNNDSYSWFDLRQSVPYRQNATL